MIASERIETLLWLRMGLASSARPLDSESKQKASQREQDGSEVRSVELENLLAQGLTLIERRNAAEFMRDTAVDLFEKQLRTPWRPHHGSLVSHRTLTAAMIDSREFLAAKSRREHDVIPSGASDPRSCAEEHSQRRRQFGAIEAPVMIYREPEMLVAMLAQEGDDEVRQRGARVG